MSPNVLASTAPRLSDDDFLARAGDTARELGERAIDLNSHGPALFLAAHGLVTDDARSRSLAIRSLEPFRRMLQAHRFGNRRRTPAALGLSSVDELGSVIYSMTTIGRMLGDDSLIEDALAMAEFLTPDLVYKDAEFGSAGAVLGLLKLHQATGAVEVLAKAIVCGDHLVASRTRIRPGVAAWKTPPGTSGVTMALARLHGVVGKPAYLTAAAEGLAYEPDLGTWHDPRDYGLSRLSIRRTSPAEVDVREIDHALDATIGQPLAALDSLCGGNFGRTDFLLVAASELRRPWLADEARTLASSAVHRAQHAVGYELTPSVAKSVFSPGFLQGSAGAGYTLLRLAHPNLLPSVLIWD